MHTVRAELRAMPLLVRWAVVAGTAAVLLGAAAGIVAGIANYDDPRVWLFAELEGSFFAGVAGMVLGFLAATLLLAGRGIGRLIGRAG